MRLIIEGKPSSFISAECNCYSSTITYYRKKLKLPTPSIAHPQKQEIIAALAAKKPWKWIEKEYNCSSGTISRYKNLRADNSINTVSNIMSGQKPSVGRIVHYIPTEEERTGANFNQQEKAPAVITAVWSDTLVNLQVLNDGDQSPTRKLSIQMKTETLTSSCWEWPARD